MKAVIHFVGYATLFVVMSVWIAAALGVCWIAIREQHLRDVSDREQDLRFDTESRFD